jgi:hypothetical protein
MVCNVLAIHDVERINMKTAFLLLSVVILLPADHAIGAESLSLLGTWTGQRERLAKVEGWREGVATLVITEQKGRTFTGHLNRSNADGDVNEPLWGAFTPGGRLLVAADEEGTYSFDLIDSNTLDYCYTEAAPSPRAVCARLTRQP